MPVLPPVATKHRRRAKENAPAILAASHDRGLSPAAAFARIASDARFETSPVLAHFRPADVASECSIVEQKQTLDRPDFLSSAE
jgi:hypothetical protein